MFTVGNPAVFYWRKSWELLYAKFVARNFQDEKDRAMLVGVALANADLFYIEQKSTLVLRKYTLGQYIRDVV